ncbi:uncharacterized protein [Littorina saxatilis]
MRRYESLLFTLFLWMVVASVKGAANITECPLGGVMLREDRYPAILTCQGFSDTDTVTWSVKAKGTLDKNLISCRPNQSFSYNSSERDLLVGRTGNVSQLYILNEYRLRAGRASIQCSIGTGNTMPCDVEAVNPASMTSSDCQLVMRNDDWTVLGNCSFVGAYSTQDIYTCSWHQQGAGQPSVETAGGINKTKIVKNQAEYYNGMCSFTSSLPTVEGDYSYTVDFFPGPDTKPSVGVTIQRPGLPVTRCPELINTTENIHCHCLPNPTTPGSPLPTLQWRGLGSSERVIPDITALNIAPLCQLTWGPPGQQVELSTKLADGPERVFIIRPGGSLVVGEVLPLVCSVSNAYPDATVKWTSTMSGNSYPCDEPETTSTRSCTFTVQNFHNRESVTCTGRNTEYPERLFGSDTYEILLA